MRKKERVVSERRFAVTRLLPAARPIGKTNTPPTKIEIMENHHNFVTNAYAYHNFVTNTHAYHNFVTNAYAYHNPVSSVTRTAGGSYLRSMLDSIRCKY